MTKYSIHGVTYPLIHWITEQWDSPEQLPAGITVTKRVHPHQPLSKRVKVAFICAAIWFFLVALGFVEFYLTAHSPQTWPIEHLVVWWVTLIVILLYTLILSFFPKSQWPNLLWQPIIMVGFYGFMRYLIFVGRPKPLAEPTLHTFIKTPPPFGDDGRPSNLFLPQTITLPIDPKRLKLLNRILTENMAFSDFEKLEPELKNLFPDASEEHHAFRWVNPMRSGLIISFSVYFANRPLNSPHHAHGKAFIAEENGLFSNLCFFRRLPATEVLQWRHDQTEFTIQEGKESDPCATD